MQGDYLESRVVKLDLSLDEAILCGRSVIPEKANWKSIDLQSSRQGLGCR